MEDEACRLRKCRLLQLSSGGAVSEKHEGVSDGTRRANMASRFGKEFQECTTCWDSLSGYGGGSEVAGTKNLAGSLVFCFLLKIAYTGFEGFGSVTFGFTGVDSMTIGISRVLPSNPKSRACPLTV